MKKRLLIAGLVLLVAVVIAVVLLRQDHSGEFGTVPEYRVHAVSWPLLPLLLAAGAVIVIAGARCVRRRGR